ncbi:helix-turn-helix domain-containing protein [Chryseobacterium sp. HMWF035]|uniref:helix-turn-helix domain-containing protein n=1 Tax=Chryseobacterium sp. HMWF035 TaxID=2056868 RepID=UPI000D56EF92|nr:helix-turn-helix transcriptional regulator [Chryseobacterium sp. HMWF035]PVV61901.1 hypothetical protein DD829_00565 [Chryseobacterium sp. HMWF035]
MSSRKYQKKGDFPHPHLGELVRKIIDDKKLTQAEVARRMQISPTSLANYFNQSSLQFGIVWNIGLAIGYDFLTELTNYYPSTLALNEDAKIVKELTEKTQRIADMEKEIEIYKAALGIKR